MDAGRNLDTAYDRPAPDRYRLQFWPAPLGPTVIVRQTSEIARYWHGVVGTIAPPADRDPSSSPMPAPPAPGSALTPGDLGGEPGFTSLIHSFVLRLTDPSGALPVIELFAQDGTDDVRLVDDELRWTVVFRNGGMEVLTSDQRLLDRLPAIAAATPTVGTVRTWHDEEGWGVIDSPETPGGAWVHFSVVAVAGHHSLSPGQRVHLEWEQVVDQDGHRFRATRAWPVGAEPVETVPQPPNDAYRSSVTMTVSFDLERPGDDRG